MRTLRSICLSGTKGVSEVSLSMMVIVVLLSSMSLIQCVRSPLKTPDQALRPVSGKTQALLTVSDDMNLAAMKDGLRDLIAAHEQRLNMPLRFGPKTVERATYVASLKKLLKALDKSATEFHRILNEDFQIYEVYGEKKYGDVFITSYFEPVLKAAKKPTGSLIQPLYGLPKDLVTIDIKGFQERFQSAPWAVAPPDEQKSAGSTLRGRLQPAASPGEVSKIVPYFDRKEIDELKSLKGRGLEIAYVDPIDAFVLQIQGSGTLVFSGGERWKVGYTAQNGYPYIPIGKFLVDKIPIEKMSLQKIEQALRAMPLAEQQKLMNQNPSYVFFRVLPGPAQTYFGTRVIEGRTIATDQKLFPKGVLSLLEFDRPVFASASAGAGASAGVGPGAGSRSAASADPSVISAAGSDEPVSAQRVQRLVFDQDTGGAIRGPGRVDLFWGAGDEAKRYAGVMKSRGRLFYFVPR